MAKYWKQPISTEILYKEGFTIIDTLVWSYILLNCRGVDGPLHIMHGNKRIELNLKRGQMFFPVNTFVKEVGIIGGRKRVLKIIKKLQKWYNEVDIERTRFGLLLTVKNYDEIIKMDNERDIERTSKGHRKDNEGTHPIQIEQIEEIVQTGVDVGAASKFSKPQRVCQILGISMDKLDIIEDIVLDYRDRDFIGVAQKVKLQGRIDGKPDDQKIFTFTGWLSREHRKKEDKEEKKDPYANYPVF